MKPLPCLPYNVMPWQAPLESTYYCSWPVSQPAGERVCIREHVIAASSRPMKLDKCPALDQLRERLSLDGVDVDVVRVAKAFLGVITELDARAPQARVRDWIEQLALDVANLRHPEG